MFEGLLQPMPLLLIAGLALLVFGPPRPPEVGRGLGEAIRGFKPFLNEDTPTAPATTRRERAERPSIGR